MLTGMGNRMDQMMTMQQQLINQPVPPQPIANDARREGVRGGDVVGRVGNNGPINLEGRGDNFGRDECQLPQGLEYVKFADATIC